MKQIRFDVGANDGESNLQWAREGHEIYAFEPTPELIKIIKSKTAHMVNYHLFPYAVSNFTGRAKFNVAANWDWGCSSLHEFSDHLATTWPGRIDFKKTHEIEVDVIKLEDFLNAHPEITHIDFFHCDTQGSDLNVLKGLGRYIDYVKAGCIEVSKPGYELYKGTDNDRESAERWLREHGFENLNTTPWSEEWNINFWR